jgi:hypothetical protein
MTRNFKWAVACLLLFTSLFLNVPNVNAVDPNFQPKDSTVYFLDMQEWYKSNKVLSWKNDDSYDTSPYADYLSSKKFVWRDVLSDVVSSYSQKLVVQSLIDDYRDKLRVAFSTITRNWLENTESATFNMLYHTLSGTSNAENSSSILCIDPSFGFGYTGVRLSYKLSFGVVSSFWNMNKNNLTLKLSIPLYPVGETSHTVLDTNDIVRKIDPLPRDSAAMLLP